MRHYLTLVAIVIGITPGLPAWSHTEAATNQVQVQVREAVEAYCEADFRGLPKRDSLTTYSPVIRKAHAEDWGWPLVSWTWDPLTVAASYRIRNLIANDSTGFATVDFDEIARSPGRGRFVGIPRRVSTVTLALKRNGEGWLVSDPPEPRVSRSALVEAYSTQLAQTGNEDWFKGASVQQVVWYQGMLEALRFLKSLK